MRHPTLDSWAVKCLTQCCAFSLWDQSAPATSSLSSTHKGDQAGVPDSCTWLRFLGKQLKSLTLQMISPKHHPYKRRLIQPYSLRETRNSKEASRMKGGRPRFSDSVESTGFCSLRGWDAPWPATCWGGKRTGVAMLSGGIRGPCTGVSVKRGRGEVED